MILSPHLLIRIGGLPFGLLNDLNSAKLQLELINYRDAITIREKVKLQLSEQMFETIQQLSDSKNQNIVQNARRSIFNNKLIGATDSERVRDLLLPAHQALWDDYHQILSDVNGLAAQLRESYQTETKRILEDLLIASQNENLKKGLVFASQSFLSSLERIPPTGLEKNKRHLNTALTLLKYITRAGAKTSPFSTFTTLALSHPGVTSDELIEIREETSVEPESLTGHINLNNGLFRLLLAIFYSTERIFIHLPLRVNPTLRLEADIFQYLINRDNVESFQSVPNNEIISFLLSEFEVHPEGIKFKDIVSLLKENVDSSESECSQYLKGLTDAGLFDFDLGISGNDPDWSKKLIYWIRQDQCIEDAMGGLVDDLERIDRLMKEYQMAESSKRVAIMKAAHELFFAAIERLRRVGVLSEAGMPVAHINDSEIQHIQTDQSVTDRTSHNDDNPESTVSPRETKFSFKLEQMFYEDVVRKVKGTIDNGQLTELIEKVDSLISEIHLFDAHWEEKVTMNHFFKSKYGENQQVDLLTFYKDYFKEIKKPNEITKDNRVVVLAEVTMKKQHMAEWKRMFIEEIDSSLQAKGSPIRISLSQLKRTNQRANLQAYKKHGSFASFVQLFSETDAKGKEHLKGVFNSIFMGYGKMISRYLPYFPSQVTIDIRSLNSSLMKEDYQFVENIDSAVHNANLHPPLMPYEIRVPGGHNSVHPDEQVRVVDCYVKYDPPTGELQLKNKLSDKRIFLFDLGFVSHKKRSPLFKLLDKFSFSGYLHHHGILSAINEEYKKRKTGDFPMTVIPRVEYEEDVVLQRKTWIVSKVFFPAKKDGQSDEDYFVMFNSLRMQHEIDDTVFVFVNRNESGENKGHLSADDYKPQYINFNNPLLLKLFERMLIKTISFITLVEMLPGGDKMTHINNEKFVTEHLIEWYR
jgi:hypothetical protein